MASRPLTLCVLGFALLAGGCDGASRPRTFEPPRAASHRLALGRVEVRSLPVVYPVPGSVVARRRLQVASRVNGFIERVAVDEGDVVEAEALLVEIDDSQVEAAIRAAQAELLAARAELEDASSDVGRFEGLARSQALAKDRLRAARVRQANARARLSKAQAELEARRQERRYTRITSPARAQVSERLRDPGELAVPGEPILRLERLREMDLEIYIPGTRIGEVAVGEAVAVEVEGRPEPLRGRVASVVHSADPVTRRCKVRIALPRDSVLTPGSFGRARILLGETRVAVVPAGAIVRRSGLPGVFVIGADGRARFRGVRLGRHWPGLREVLAGVEAGTRVALDPPEDLREGDPVLPRAPESH